MGSFAGKFKSLSVERETPQDLFDGLNERFHFTCDVAASASNAKCPVYFTKKEDGLAQSWTGVCWMNPPYGREIQRWLRKAVEEARRGVVVVALVPARTNTVWFHDLCLCHGKVEFVRGRPKFGDMKHGLPQPLAIVVFGLTGEEA